MDLSQALAVCRTGVPVRDDINMTLGWSIRWVPTADKKSGVYRYFNPKGEAAHLVVFHDRFKGSVAWRDVP